MIVKITFVHLVTSDDYENWALLRKVGIKCRGVNSCFYHFSCFEISEIKTSVREIYKPGKMLV
jgi:hypothetical protein